MKDAWFTYFFSLFLLFIKTKKMYFFSALIEYYCNLVCFDIKNTTKLKVFSPIFGPNFVTLQLYMILLFHYPIKLNFKVHWLFPKDWKKIQIFFSIDMELSELVHFLFHSFPAYLLIYLRLALLSNWSWLQSHLIQKL